MTTVNDVLGFLKNVITEMKDIEDDQIRFESTLQDLELDSLDYVEIQLAIKKQYCVDVGQSDFVESGIETVGDFCAFVSNATAMAKAKPALQGAGS